MSSLIVARTRYELPNEGLHPAVITEIERVEDEYGGDRLRFTFELADEKQENGYPKRVFRTCTFKLTAQSALTEIVTSILGRSLTATEWEGLDLAAFIGRKVQVVVKHQVSERSGQTYAKVDSIVHVADEPADQATGADDAPKVDDAHDDSGDEDAAQDTLPFA